MNKRPFVIRGVIALAAITALTVLRYEPWEATAQASAREHLTVGFLPVT